MRYIMLLLLFFPSVVFASWPYLPGPGFAPEAPAFVYDYCVRNDGMATKTAATDCSSAATSMSPTTFNASTFVDNDVIAISSRGGDISTGGIIPLSGGSTIENSITIQGEPGHLPNIIVSAGMIVDVSNLIIRDITSSGGGESPFLFRGANSGIVTYNLRSLNAGNQGFQHLNTVSVTHNNLYTSGAVDEGVSLHDDVTVTINGGSVVDNYHGFNYVGTGALTVNNVVISGNTDHTIDPANSAGFEATFNGCLIVENGTRTDRAIDIYDGAYKFYNCIFIGGLTKGDFYLLARSTMSSIEIVNCLFYGGSYASTTAIFNQVSNGVYRNNIFLNTGTEALWGTTGTISNNSYYNSGTARGTDAQAGDPLLTDPANGDYSTGAGSPCIGNGYDASALFTTDYNQDARTVPWDIGPIKE